MLDSRNFVVRTLLADGVIVESDIRRATEHAAANGCDILDSMVSVGAVTTRRLAIAKARICEYPFVDLGHYEIDFRNTKFMPRAVAERLSAFPLFVVDGVATVAMLDPLDLQAIDQVRQVLKTEVDPVLADSEQLKGLIARSYSLSRMETPEDGAKAVASDEALTTGDEPIVAAVNQMLSAAADMGASDVHINPDENELHLRYRVDGILQSHQGPAKGVHSSIVQRLKVMAKLDLTQTRRPQDGKFRFTHKGEAVDVRLSLLPTIHGENVVMRLLRSASRIGSVKDLGMPEQMTQWFEEAIAKPHGMVLVTGPTGSGKTTTLYTALNRINSPDRNIITIEDPVEVRLPMIRQVQTNSEIGLTFAAALRSVLRQDPDVVLVGEIRDQETAKIAVQAAMTGHLVFSTLHTNDAVGAVARLKDMGLPAFAINSAVLCVIAQRLVRKLCQGCCEPETAPEQLARVPGSYIGLRNFKRPVGCNACRGLGYKGRMGVYEMFRLTPRVQSLIEQGATQQVIEQEAYQEGMRLMWEDALSKAGQGWTTIEEALRLRVHVDDTEVGVLPGVSAGAEQREAA